MSAHSSVFASPCSIAEFECALLSRCIKTLELMAAMIMRTIHRGAPYSQSTCAYTNSIIVLSVMT